MQAQLYQGFRRRLHAHKSRYCFYKNSKQQFTVWSSGRCRACCLWLLAAPLLFLLQDLKGPPADWRATCCHQSTGGPFKYLGGEASAHCWGWSFPHQPTGWGQAGAPKIGGKPSLPGGWQPYWITCALIENLFLWISKQGRLGACGRLSQKYMVLLLYRTWYIILLLPTLLTEEAA